MAEPREPEKQSRVEEETPIEGHKGESRTRTAAGDASLRELARRRHGQDEEEEVFGEDTAIEREKAHDERRHPGGR